MKINRITKYLMSLLMSVLFFLPLMAQDMSKTYGEIEKTQDRIEDLYIEVYDIVEDYPDVTYNYVYDNGEVTEIIIEGVTDNRDQKQLEVYLLDIEDLKNDIYNMSNRVGIYYVAESEPKPKTGFDEFYTSLHNDLQYPESAENRNVQGTIYVKFVVDHEGNVSNVIAAEDVEAPADFIVQDMKKEAKEIVKATSGQWEPAMIGSVPVAHWVVLPVQFKIEQPYFRPVF